jgi:hypothetical protein
VIQFMMWVEQLSYSTWVRVSNSIWAFPMYLFAHTLGMSIVAGGAAMISMALLGLWPKTPLKPLERMYPVMMWGFWVNAFTGVSIFMKDASVYSRNVDFYVKLVFIFFGMVLLLRIRKQVFSDPDLDNRPVTPAAKRLAWASLICWFGAICAGRLIAYVGPVAGL